MRRSASALFLLATASESVTASGGQRPPPLKPPAVHHELRPASARHGKAMSSVEARANLCRMCTLLDPVAVSPTRHERRARLAALHGLGTDALGDGELLRIAWPVFPLVGPKHFDPIVAGLERIVAQLVVHAYSTKGPQCRARCHEQRDQQRGGHGSPRNRFNHGSYCDERGDRIEESAHAH